MYIRDKSWGKKGLINISMIRFNRALIGRLGILSRLRTLPDKCLEAFSISEMSCSVNAVFCKVLSRSGKLK